MKKTYQAPETMLLVAIKEQAILTGSESSRAAEGTPTTQAGGGLPSGIGETSQTGDPFSDSEGNDKGQGGGGGTTRAKMWDDTWDLPQWWNF